MAKSKKTETPSPFTITLKGRGVSITVWANSKKDAINRFLSDVGVGVPFEVKEA
jgi:hypothetical protein